MRPESIKAVRSTSTQKNCCNPSMKWLAAG